jgi:uncharacterized protein YndB with AHSA1/START domain
MATMTASTTDRIEKQVDLEAPRSRVWRALTDSQQFGAWFGVKLTAPFKPGAPAVGTMTYKGEEVTMTMWIDRIEPENFFSFHWHPFGIDKTVDYSAEPKTLVSFTLEDAAAGTRLTIRETGFDRIPESRRALAFEMNTKGWIGQAEKIRQYVMASQS